MSYQSGSYIYHNDFGVGLIIEIIEKAETELKVQYKNKTPILQPVYLLQRSTSQISNHGFHVLMFNDPEKAKELIQKSQVEVLLAVLHDFPGFKAKTDDIRFYLSQYIPEWEIWWKKTQQLLKEDQRIDTSRSKQQEYSIAKEARSLAEEYYQNYRSRKLHSGTTGEMAGQALAALQQNQKGEQLTQEHFEEIRQFLDDLIRSKNNDISMRLNLLFHLQEDKLIQKDTAYLLLKNLLDEDFNIYELDLFTSKRVIESLIHMPEINRMIEKIATGICVPNESQIRLLEDWIIKRGNTQEILLFLTTALKVNLPPFTDESHYSSFKYRLEANQSFVKCLSQSSFCSIDFTPILKDINLRISMIAKIENVTLLLPSFIQLVLEIENKSIENNNFSANKVLIDNSFPLTYWLSLLDVSINNPKFSRYHNDIESYLLSNADELNFDYLKPFVESNWNDPVDEATQIMIRLNQTNSKSVIESGGNTIYCLIQRSPDNNILVFLPILDQLSRIAGDWTWKNIIEALREKCYTQIFLGQHNQKKSFDKAIYNAAQEYLKSQMIELRNEVDLKQIEIDQLQGNVNRLKVLLDEKESVLKELKGGFSVNTDRPKFEEKIRIFKELSNVLAGIERYAHNQENPPRELTAVITQLVNIFHANEIMEMEEIGSTVQFNQQKHRLIEASDIKEGNDVIIVERGYLIRDQNSKTWLLKPALVKISE